MGGHNLEETNPSKNYTKEINPFDGKIQLIKLSFQLLKSSISSATTTIIDRLWTESSLQSYISPISVNTNEYNHLVNHCNNVNASNFIDGSDVIDIIMEQMILSDYKLQSENI